MSSNRSFGLLLTIVVMGIVALTIREGAATSAVVKQVQAQKAQLSQGGQDAESARWLAMGKFYESQTSEASLTGSPLLKPLTSYDAAEAMAYRWQAMAQFYVKHSQDVSGAHVPTPLTAYDAEETSTYRWRAIGDYYIQDGFATNR